MNDAETTPVTQFRQLKPTVSDDLAAEVLKSLRDISRKLDAHIRDEKSNLDKILALVVPDGDIDGHRRYHESKITQARREEEFNAAMKKEVGKYGILALLGFLGASMWFYFKYLVGKGIA